MMIMVEGMARAGFFRWLCMTIAKGCKVSGYSDLYHRMIMSTVLAMFIDSITVILFLAAVTVELAQLLKFNPVPMILSEDSVQTWEDRLPCRRSAKHYHWYFTGYSFADFITNTGLIALISLFVILIYFLLCIP